MPGMRLIRPGDANETVAAWRTALVSEGPTILALTRQGVPLVANPADAAEGTPRGAYVVLNEAPGQPDVIIIATGSEVSLALEGVEILTREGITARVVSMPSWELFEEQPAAYQDSVLPPSITARLSVEAGATFGWERYVGPDGDSLGIDRFGASAPAGTIYTNYGLTAEAVAARAAALVRKA